MWKSENILCRMKMKLQCVKIWHRHRHKGDTEGEEGDVKLEVQIEWCAYKPRNAKDYQQPLEARRNTWNGFSLTASRRN